MDARRKQTSLKIWPGIFTIWHIYQWHFYQLAFLPVAFLPTGIFTNVIFTIWHFYQRHFYQLAFLPMTFLPSGIFTNGIFTIWHFYQWHFYRTPIKVPFKTNNSINSTMMALFLLVIVSKKDKQTKINMYFITMYHKFTKILKKHKKPPKWLLRTYLPIPAVGLTCIACFSPIFQSILNRFWWNFARTIFESHGN